jgi:hypothetical protein
MGTKFGLVAGFTTGYVLGTQAGRQRYEQIRKATQTLMGSQTAKTLQVGLRDAWGTAQQEVPGAVGSFGSRLLRR